MTARKTHTFWILAAYILTTFLPAVTPQAIAQPSATEQNNQATAEIPDNWETCMQKGGTLKVDGRYDEAAPFLLKAVSLAEAKFGKNDPRYVLAVNLLAGNSRYQGKLAEAQTLYKEELEIARKNKFPDELIATILDNMSGVHSTSGNLAEAAQTTMEAIELYKKSVGENNVDYAMALGSYGITMMRMGKRESAEKYLVRAVELLQSLPNANPIAVATNSDNLAILYASVGRLDDAEKYNRIALALYEKVLPAGHPDWIICMQNLGNLLSQKGDYAGSMKVFDSAVEVINKTRGGDSLEAKEATRLQATVGSHIPGWKPSSPTVGSEQKKPRKEQVLDILAKLDAAYPNVNTSQISEIMGQTLLKGRIPYFWYAQITDQTLFKALTAHLIEGRDIPQVITLALQENIGLNKKDIIQKFGAARPDPSTEGSTESMKYERKWGVMGIVVDKPSGNVTAAGFVYK